MRLALAQINTVVGDLDGNAARIARAARRGARAGADLVLFPELAVTGYPPEDLLLRPAFVRAARRSGRRDRRARRTASPRSSARRTSTPTSTTRASCSPTARSAASTASATCPTTASSTRTATSRPGDDLLLLRFGDVLVGVDDLRGHLAAGPARDRPRARRRAAHRQHLGVAVPRRQGPRARGDAARARARQRRASSRSATPSAARTS